MGLPRWALLLAIIAQAVSQFCPYTENCQNEVCQCDTWDKNLFQAVWKSSSSHSQSCGDCGKHGFLEGDKCHCFVEFEANKDSSSLTEWHGNCCQYSRGWLYGEGRPQRIAEGSNVCPHGKYGPKCSFVAHKTETSFTLVQEVREFVVQDLPCVTGEWSEWSPCSRSCVGGFRSRQRSLSNCKETPSEEVQNCNDDIPCQVVSDNCTCDVALLIDASFSIPVDEWENVGIFIDNMVASNAPRIGFVMYNSQVKTIEPGISENKQLVGNEAKAYPKCNSQTCSGTYTFDGLNASRVMLDADKSGNCKILMVVTDGFTFPERYGNKTLEVARSFHLSYPNIVTFAIGVGQKYAPSTFESINVRELQAIASHPDNVILLNDYSALPEQVSKAKQCPITTPCIVNPWQEWSACSQPCGDGFQTRTRTVLVSPPNHEGCPDLSEQRPCNLKSCECQLGNWTEWGECSKTCGGGIKKRTRSVIVSGPICGSTEETDSCNINACECTTSEWGAWGDCSAKCDGGVRSRNRTITKGEPNCAATTVSEPCNTIACTCVVSEWSAWEPCSATCGGGVTRRTRPIITPGLGCVETVVESKCRTEPCCTLSEWSPWGQCSSACKGTSVRTRVVTKGTCKNATLSETKDCNTDCACVYGEWSSWGSCSQKCGGGQKNRTRVVISGTGCVDTIAFGSCNANPCTCLVGEWSAWGLCSKLCGNGQRERTRDVTGEMNCPPTSEVESCNSAPCRNCSVSEWGAWSTCSKPCGVGLRNRSRTVTIQGDNCPQTLESEACNIDDCVCTVGPWSDWSTCSKSCDGGVTSRTRDIVQAGLSCPSATQEIKTCNPTPCPCNPGPWSAWSPCSRTCKGGYQSRTRSTEGCNVPSIEVRDCSVGVACTLETCNCSIAFVLDASINVTLDEWSKTLSFVESSVNGVGGASSTFGATTYDNKANVISMTNGPALKTELGKVLKCNNPQCIGNYLHTGFSEAYKDLVAKGGNGCKIMIVVSHAATTPSTFQSNTLSAAAAMHKENPKIPVIAIGVGEAGSYQALSLVELQALASSADKVVLASDYSALSSYSFLSNTCPAENPCVVGPWTEFSVCTKTCGGGVSTRTRSIVVNGANCPATREVVDCNVIACDCELGDWESWSPCTKTCGGGSQTRKRSVITQGLKCPATLEARNCNEQDCPCGDTEWSLWSLCSKSCTGGFQTRSRSVPGVAPICKELQTQEIRSCNSNIQCTIPPNSNCTCDIMLLVDASYSIAEEEWPNVGKFITDIASSNAPRVGVIMYNNVVNIIGSGLTSEKATLVSQATAFPKCTSYKCSGTYTFLGLQKTRELLEADNGKNCKIIMVITDGFTFPSRFRPQTFKNAQDLHIAHPDWLTIAVGVGQKYAPSIFDAIDPQELQAIASHPEDVILLSDYNGLDSLRATTRRCPATNPCIVNPWGEWSACNKQCGTGTRSRNRTVLVKGDNCPPLVETQDCNPTPCDCTVADWGVWTSCSKTCGGGVQTRSRAIVTPGANCPLTLESQTCNTQQCGCGESAWSVWSPCTKTCAGGFQSRTRTVANSDDTCQKLTTQETRECNQLVVCPAVPVPDNCTCNVMLAIDASYSIAEDEWPNVAGFVKSLVPSNAPALGVVMYNNKVEVLGGGLSPDKKLIADLAATYPKCVTYTCSGTYTFDALTRTQQVLEADTSKNCQVVIVITDGFTFPIRNRPKTFDAAAKMHVAHPDWVVLAVGVGQKYAPNVFESIDPAELQAIASHPDNVILLSEYKGLSDLKGMINKCPKPNPCIVNPWGPWSNCSLPCGGGSTTRTRTILVKGDNCPPTSETQTCNSQACDCTVGTWGAWGSCSKACGGGLQTRTRSVLTAGNNCPATIDSQVCNTQNCPCGEGEWSTWSTCSKTCGGGFQSRTRTIQGAAENCLSLPTTQSRSCNDAQCPSPPVGKNNCTCNVMLMIDASLSIARSEWPNVGNFVESLVPSSAPRLGVVMYHYETTVVSPLSTNKRAVADKAKAFPKCTESSCSGTYAFDAIAATRKVLEDDKSNNCQIIIVITDGFTWPQRYASRTFDAARSLHIAHPDWVVFAVGVGAKGAADPFEGINPAELQAMASHPDNVILLSEYKGLSDLKGAITRCPSKDPCIVGPWGEWSQCSKTCGAGVITRTRETIVKGLECPPSSESLPCNTQACQCVVGEWSNWQTCSASCGSGVSKRTREITMPGENCPVTTDTKSCNTQPCSCGVSEWSRWSSCSKTCKGGLQTRTRTIKGVTDNCLALPKEETRECNSGVSCPPEEKKCKCNVMLVIDASYSIDEAEWPNVGKFITDVASSDAPRIGVVMYNNKAQTIGTGLSADKAGIAKLASSFPKCTTLKCSGTYTYLALNQSRSVVEADTSGNCQLVIVITDGFTFPERLAPLTFQVAKDLHVAHPNWVVMAVGVGQRNAPDIFEAINPKELQAIASHPDNVILLQDYHGLSDLKGSVSKCPVDNACVVGPWSDWSVCSKTCGNGQRTRTREIIVKGDGKCPPVTESEPCSIGTCGCVLGDWSAWSACSKTCGSGIQTKTRAVLVDGSNCDTTLTTQSCNTQACPCGESEWSQWSVCSKTCKGGLQSRTRTISNPADECKKPTEEVRDCNQRTECAASSDNCTCNVMLAIDASYSIDIEEWPRVGEFVTSVAGSAAPKIGVVMYNNIAQTLGSGMSSDKKTIADLAVQYPKCITYKCSGTYTFLALDTLQKTVEAAPLDPKSCTVVIVITDGFTFPERLSSKTYDAARKLHVDHPDWVVMAVGVGQRNAPDIFEAINPKELQAIASHPDNVILLKEYKGLQDIKGAITKCPVKDPCIVGPWSDWGTCSKPCGQGKRNRTRATIVNGANCPPTIETEDCNTGPCDCLVSNFGEWSPCSASCGGGVQTQTRVITQVGQGCPKTIQTQTCNTQPCSCGETEWSLWSSCSKTCSGGFQTRTRSVNNATNCANLPTFESRDCNSLIQCAGANNTCTCDVLLVIDASYSIAEDEWPNVGDFITKVANTVTPKMGVVMYNNKVQVLGNGMTTDKAGIAALSKDYPKCTQYTCSGTYTFAALDKAKEVFETDSSNNCKILMVVTDGFTFPSKYRQKTFASAQKLHLDHPDWTTMAVGVGQKYAPSVFEAIDPEELQAIASHPDNVVLLNDYSGLINIINNLKRCPTQNACIVNPWGPWSECTKTCGSGSRTRTRTTLVSGQNCPSTTETEACNVKDCCKVSEWSAWGQCSAPCGDGNQTRKREIVTGDINCLPMTDSRGCSNPPCTGCTISEWSLWTACDATCGGGKKTRTRKIESGNCNIQPNLVDTQPCNTDNCPCDIREWSEWTVCSKPCLGGYQTRTRAIVTTTPNCQQLPTSQARECNAGIVCPSDNCNCAVYLAIDASSSIADDEWPLVKDFANKVIDGPSESVGLTVYNKDIIAESSSALTTDKAALKAKVNAMTKCADPKCADTSTYLVINNANTQPDAGAPKCKILILITDGATTPAANISDTIRAATTLHKNKPDLTVISIGVGQKNAPEPFGALNIPELQSIASNPDNVLLIRDYSGLAKLDSLVNKCPAVKPCILGAWSDWSACSAKCEGGIQKRTRDVVVQGDACLSTEESRKCNTQACGCVTEDWSEWSPCSVTCGGGVQTRTRAIKSGGAECANTPTLESAACAVDDCPCGEGEWSAWTDCSKTCLGGYQTSTRTIANRVGKCENVTTVKTRDCNSNTPCSPPKNTCVCDVLLTIDASYSIAEDEWPLVPKFVSEVANGPSKALGLVGYNNKITLSAPVTEDKASVNDKAKTLEKCKDYSCSGTYTWLALDESQKVLEADASGRCKVLIVITDGFTFPERNKPKTIQKAIDLHVAHPDWSVVAVGVGQKNAPDIYEAIDMKELQTIASHPDNVILLDQYSALSSIVSAAQKCPPPVDSCIVGAWSDWTPCSASCGGGQQTRTRDVVVKGSNCLPTQESRTCNIIDCECKYETSEWTPCSVTCGGGVQTQTRKLVTGNPNVCKDVGQNVQVCNTEKCQCIPGPWSAWTDCSKTCLGGYQTSTRTVNKNDALCENTTTVQTRTCNSDVDCGPGAQPNNCTCNVALTIDASYSIADDEWPLVSKFVEDLSKGPTPAMGIVWYNKIAQVVGSGVSSDKKSIVDGFKAVDKCRSYTCSGTYTYLGLNETQTMFENDKTDGKCKVMIVITDGFTFPEKNKPQTIQKAINLHQTHSDWIVVAVGVGQKNAPDVFEAIDTKELQAIASEPDNVILLDNYLYLSKILDTARKCPVPDQCIVGMWNEWSPCGGDCGAGKQTRTRNIIKPGNACPPLQETRNCVPDLCCDFSEWGEWTDCSVSCGGGIRTKTRTLKSGGAACIAPTQEVDQCNLEDCPCVEGEWSEWSPCSKSCLGGLQTRTRQLPACSSKRSEDSRTCNSNVACNTADNTCSCDVLLTIDASYSIAPEEWPLVGKFVEAVGNGPSPALGVVTYNNQVKVLGNGVTKDKQSIVNEMFTVQKCGVYQCSGTYTFLALNTSQSVFEAFNSANCKILIVITDGFTFPEKQKPKTFEAAKKLHLDHPDWITMAVGVGQKNAPDRFEAIDSKELQAIAGNSEDVMLLDDYSQLINTLSNVKKCPKPKPCVLSPWSDYTECSAPCKGQKSRTRTVLVGESNCAPLKEDAPCGSEECDCLFSDWGNWTDCSATCGGGLKYRTRDALGGPKSCSSNTTESQVCNTDPCPCTPGEWSTWTTCSKTCLGGFQTRSRSLNGCSQLPSVETRTCNVVSCGEEPGNNCTCDVLLVIDSSYSISPQDWPLVQSFVKDVADSAAPALGVVVYNKDSKVLGNGVTTDKQSLVTLMQGTNKCNDGSCSGTATWAALNQASNLYESSNRDNCKLVMVVTDGFTFPESDKPLTLEASKNLHQAHPEWIVVAVGVGQRDANDPFEAIDVNELQAISGNPDNVILLQDYRGLNRILSSIKKCPVSKPCIVGPWSDWGPCSAQCDSGIQSRTREVVVKGDRCPPLTETRPCNQDPCGCTFSDWTPWGDCSVTCGGGVQTRTQALVSGSPNCLKNTTTIDTRVCNTQECPCGESEWSDWTPCSKTCVGGYQTQSRTVPSQTATCKKLPTVNSRTCNGGVDCDEGSQPDNCTCNVVLAIDASYSISPDEWPLVQKFVADIASGPTPAMGIVVYNNIATVLSTGVTKNKAELVRLMNSVEKCDKGSCSGTATWLALNSSRVIMEADDSLNCKVLIVITDGFTFPEEYKPLTFAAARGFHVDHPNWVKIAIGVGQKYADNVFEAIDVRELQAIASHPDNVVLLSDYAGLAKMKALAQKCPPPNPCIVGPWGEWSGCNKQCDGGIQVRTRETIVQGTRCPANNETLPCNNFPCQCSYTVWSPWTQCSVPCGGGSQTRTRTSIVDSPSCKTTQESQTCNLQKCECVPSEWSVWSTCSKTCSGGFQTRTRTVTGPQDCKLTTLQTQDCGADCSGINEKGKNCTCDVLLLVDASYSIDPNDWPVVQKFVSDMAHTQAPKVGVITYNNALNVLGTGMMSDKEQLISIMNKTPKCNDGTCSGTYTWEGLKKSQEILEGNTGSNCSLLMVITDGFTFPEERKKDTLAAAKRLRTMHENWIVAAVGVGQKNADNVFEAIDVEELQAIASNPNYVYLLREYQALSQLVSFSSTCPPADVCQAGPWSEWTNCSVQCDSGSRTRTREIYKGNNDCVPTKETEVCNGPPCKCDAGEWSDWLGCTGTCGSESQTRTRKVNFVSDVCSDKEVKTCTSPACDCAEGWSKWSEWSSCSKTCGNGYQTRTRKCGEKVQQEMAACNVDPCPTQDNCTCHLLFAFDSTVSDEDWRSIQGFVQSAASAGNPTLGVLAFNDDVYTVSEPTADKSSVIKNVWLTRQKGTNRVTYKALDRSKDLLEKITDGCKILVTLTTGLTAPESDQPKTLDSAKKILAAHRDWATIAVGVGKGLSDPSELQVIAGSPSGVYYLSQFSELNNLLSLTSVCPIPDRCIVDAWGPWGNCTRECGSGQRTRTRSVIAQGKDCPLTQETNTCNDFPCDQCMAGEWSKWSSCTKECGGGVRSRSRTLFGANDCPPSYEEEPCNTDVCIVDPCTCVAKSAATISVSLCKVVPDCVSTSDCGDRGTCTNGMCVCQPGWRGAKCNIAPSCERCPSDRGSCVNGTCQCLPPFTGPFCDRCAPLFDFNQFCNITCEFKTNCSGNGYCNSNGTCTCLYGWQGTNCSDPIVAIVDPKAGAAASCGSASPIVPVVVAVAVTLAVVALALLAFFLWRNRTVESGFVFNAANLAGANRGWQSFEDDVVGSG